MIAGSATGFGMMGAGMNSFFRSQKEECSLEDWVTSAALGFVAGAATGGVVGAATAGIMGAGVALSTATISQQVGIGAIAGSVGGACQSLASDVERNLLDDENIGAGEMLKNAACSALIGTAVGAAGGAISSRIGGLLAFTDADEVAWTALLRKSGVNSINILLATRNFTARVECRSQNRKKIQTTWLMNSYSTRLKAARKYVDEIDPSRQFHQR
jgi:hypothetical protein